ncbi:MAG: bifunctional folylpolyglutamate synthase/dihydrofolate synthase [Candidatus Hydrogenedens sp.]|nr:bifunctional folylpolyglutamate synthase/dihydrofolate synthase [Candidatus Hydrogenedens sp.]
MSGPAVGTPRARLDDLILHGIKLGLDNIRALQAAVGNPERACPAVHVAGTNGKGSVLAFLDTMLQSAGYLTARFTSPHLISLNERFLVEGAPLADAVVDGVLERLLDSAEARGIQPTYFELCTAAAFLAFKEAGAECALIEVGMGGKYDSTNILDPEACAIVSIGLDHTQYLGDTLAAIAGEKAGIIKPGRPVVVGPLEPEALQPVLEAAAGAGAPAFVAGRDFTFQGGGDPWHPTISVQAEGLDMPETRLGLAGPHQAANAAVAVLLAHALRDTYPRLTPEHIQHGLASAVWPCRLERVSEQPLVIIDAAHNPAGMQHYRTLFSEAVVVAAFSDDKDAAGMLEVLSAFAQPLILTEYTGKRCASAAALAANLADPIVMPELPAALEHAMRLAGNGAPVLVTGSIYLAGEARAWFAGHGGSALRFRSGD